MPRHCHYAIAASLRYDLPDIAAYDMPRLAITYSHYATPLLTLRDKPHIVAIDTSLLLRYSDSVTLAMRGHYAYDYALLATMITHDYAISY